MTTRLTAAIAGATLVVGILVGASGAVVIRDATAPTFSDHMGGMAGMAGMAGMQQMMGGQGLSSMMGGSMMGPSTTMPGWHSQHHIQPDAPQP